MLQRNLAVVIRLTTARLLSRRGKHIAVLGARSTLDVENSLAAVEWVPDDLAVVERPSAEAVSTDGAAAPRRRDLTRMDGRMRKLQLPARGRLPVLGQGTWGMGERPTQRAAEVATLRHGMDSGLELIDTAEMYGSGGAEEVVGEAIRGRRDDAFLVSKVLPGNADRGATIRACEESLRRLNTDHLDLYLLHWRGSTPLAETLDAFAELQDSGKIRHFGVSNFAPADLADLFEHELGRRSATNQVLYNLTRRGIELDLLPWCQQRELPVMAYSPIEQGRLLDQPTLHRIAERHAATSAQIALAWVLTREGVCAIPKAATPEHIDANLEVLDLQLSEHDLAELEQAFPAPTRPVPLEIL